MNIPNTTTCIDRICLPINANLQTSVTNVACYGQSTGAIDLTPNITGGTAPLNITYAWTASNGGAVPAGQANMQDLTNLKAGTYTVVISVTDKYNCPATFTTTVNITQPQAALAVGGTQTNVGCFGQSTGAINITASGGTAPYTYDWADISGTSNSEDRTNLAAGTYSVTVTDAKGCTTSGSWTITQPAQLTVGGVPTHVACYGQSTGAINITVSGGTAPYKYDWADVSGTENTEDRSALAAGTYNVTITDANGCTASGSWTINQPAQLTVGAVVTQISCFGQANGAINITASGGTAPYKYDWADVAGTENSEDRSALGVGSYSVTVTDANGCTATGTWNITQPAEMGVSAQQTNVACFGQSTGALNITVTGGVAPFTYDWADLSGTNNPEDRTGLPAGSYSVTVKDAS
ncbi:MAG TPA: hypothetical protein VNU93_10260, partial [Verrucomicrobiae bacterium]|nr:hypothetical protein [Verrucomicrobiae bacterium]